MTITSDDFYMIENGAGGGLVMVPRKNLQAALDRFYARERTTDARPPSGTVHRGVKTRDAATPPMNNLAPGGRRFLPGRDQSPGTSTGSQGSTTGGTPRKPNREEKPPSLRSGTFSVDQGTGQAYKHPYKPCDPAVTDQEPDEDLGLGEKIGELPPPEPGCVYVLRPTQEGVDVIQVLDDGSSMTTADRTYRHSIGDRIDPILRRMNRVNANRTRDADMVRKTVYHHVIIEGERLALEENPQGGWDLVVYSKATTNMNGPPVMGSRQREDNPGSMGGTQAWAASPGSRPGALDIHEIQQPVRTGDRGLTEAQMLRAQNAANAKFWERRA